MRYTLLPAALILFLTVPTLHAETPSASDDTAGEAVFLKNTRQLTYGGKRAGEGYFSADGKQLIFQAEREADNPFYQIYILSLETGDSHRVSNGVGKTTCAYFRADGERVMFASTHLDPEAAQKQKDELEFRASGKERRYAWDYDETYDIFSCKPDGSDMKRLTEARGYDAEGSYSPDGKWIVFASMRDAYSGTLSEEDQKRLEMDPSYFGEIYIMAADGSGQKRLTTEPGYDGGPFFTPDGKRIVWRHFAPDGMVADVFTMDLEGGNRVQLTDFESMSWAPFFHPSGEYVIFTTNKLGFSNFELYIVDREGSKEPVRVTFTDGFDGLPVFAPDGKTLAWTANRTADKKSQIFMAAWNDQAARAALAAAPARDQRSSLDGVLWDRNTAVYRAPMKRDKKSQHITMSPEIRAEDMHNTVAYLADDDLAGRMTGSDGEKKARSYIATRFRDAGLTPLGDDDYLQPFPFTSGVKLVPGKNTLSVTANGETRALEVDKDFRPLAYSDNTSVEGPVAFVGYGLKTPASGEGSYDAYGGFDVTDKVLLILNYVPEGVSMERRMELNMYSGGRYKAMAARERGAKAILVVTGPTSPNAGALQSLGFDQSLAGSGIPVLSISGETADLLLKGHDKSLKEIQEQLDVENPHAEGTFDLEGVTVSISTDIEREKSQGNNVIGYLPPANNDDTAPVLVIGAHYDHLGLGESGSLADKDEQGKIHNGADDNASGTATMLELADALSALYQSDPDKFTFGIVFAAWSGEEIGVIGSNYWVQHPTLPLERVAAYLNFDMVGRMKDNTLMLQGVGSSDAWAGFIEKRNVVAGFDLKLQEDPYLPTDTYAFYPAGVPVIAFFTGSHADYHRPSDDTETLDYPDMERVAKFAMGMALDIMAGGEKLAYVKVAPSSENTGSRASMRVFLGTIPDYSEGEMEGVKLTGVRADGPADKAGLKGGDVIVELAGKEIKNIYDYTYALDALKVGEPATVVVIRDGERVSLSIIPEARK
ncbi:MAG: M28 family peptidase [Candidatus Krumholzibacteria bacterium]|nr:M28 family peptidase [Candidatus Krumholzibacteria bacterium]MDH4337416.1 M28 family peptidase [Candidatus Krumholzibacteria bacterium]MDH5270909.1 M28 family peptidase [Candidatus Krumholzibacteria bacterium]